MGTVLQCSKEFLPPPSQVGWDTHGVVGGLAVAGWLGVAAGVEG